MGAEGEEGAVGTGTQPCKRRGGDGAFRRVRAYSAEDGSSINTAARGGIRVPRGGIRSGMVPLDARESGLRSGWAKSKITCQEIAPSSKQGREATSEGK